MYLVLDPPLRATCRIEGLKRRARSDFLGHPVNVTIDGPIDWTPTLTLVPWVVTMNATSVRTTVLRTAQREF
jgi:hypothetical protein